MGVRQKDKFVVDSVDSYVTGLDSSDFNRDSIIRLVNSTSRALLVVCGGGKMSAEMARCAMSEVVAKGDAVDVIISIPMEWEGGRRVAKATALADELREVGASVTHVNYEEYIKEEDNDPGVLFTRLDGVMVEKIRYWIEQNKG
jgi:hypothetical protein